MIKKLQRDITSLSLYVISFLLLLEWLQPLQLVTDTDIISVFVIFIGFSFLFTFFQIKPFISATIKCIYIFIMCQLLYYDSFSINPEWLLNMFYENMNYIFQNEWLNLTGDFRSLLFFILLWLITYLMHYWLIIQKQILLFFFLTIMYISVLDTFTPFDAKLAIIRTVFIGFLLLSILHLTRIRKEFYMDEHKNKRIVFKWMIPMVFILMSSIVVAFLLPKAAPYWPDPVPYIKAYVDGNAGVKKVGYGTNDSTLGGPFIQDDKTVFVAEASKEHYWRIESKDFYTGKGWESTGNAPTIDMGSDNIILKWHDDKIETTPSYANIRIFEEYPHLVYPLGLTEIFADPAIHFRVNLFTEKISTLNRRDELVHIDTYRVNYKIPKYSIDELELVVSPSDSEYAGIFKDMYTQLPDSLPKRVHDLAYEIIDGKQNQYEKTRAIEDYFRNNGFVYETKNVAVPSEAEDYVDQFLFDTKKGYCDNFSTSMVVLLRAAGIPARWVKGYTSGDYVETVDATLKKYKITNNNAHSWVEVYFPQTGWVPFEPTIGYRNAAEFTYNNENQAEQTTVPENKPIDQPEEKENEPKKQDDRIDNWKLLNAISWKNVLKFLAPILIFTLIVLKTKQYWKPIIIIKMYKNRRDEQVYFKAYLALLNQLKANGLKRKDGQTLREFAIMVDNYYEMNSMKELTISYERALYRHDKASEEWLKSVELWENLIKRTAS